MSKPKRDKTRSWVAVSAHLRTSAGAMGGGKRENNRRNRQATKQQLKKGMYE